MWLMERLLACSGSGMLMLSGRSQREVFVSERGSPRSPESPLTGAAQVEGTASSSWDSSCPFSL